MKFYHIQIAAICALPAESGKCQDSQDSHKRWFYDDSRGTCMSFIYFGCAGNQNNFRSFDSCVLFCSTRKLSRTIRTVILITRPLAQHIVFSGCNISCTLHYRFKLLYIYSRFRDISRHFRYFLKTFNYRDAYASGDIKWGFSLA